MRQKLFVASLLSGLTLMMAAGCTNSSSPPPSPAVAPPPAAPPAPRAPSAPAPAQRSAPAAPIVDGLPDGPGRAETAAACTGCHGIEQVTSQHKDATGWANTVTNMINNGAPVAPADFNKIVGYLTANFGA